MSVILISLAIYVSSRCEIFYHLACDTISLISWLIGSASGRDLFKSLICNIGVSALLLLLSLERFVDSVVEILTILLFRIILLQTNSLLVFKDTSW